MTLWIAEALPSQHAIYHLRTMAELLQKAAISESWVAAKEGLLLGLDAQMPVSGKAGRLPLTMRYTARTVAAQPVADSLFAVPQGWQTLQPGEDLPAPGGE